MKLQTPFFKAMCIAATLTAGHAVQAQDRAALVVANAGYAGDLAVPAVRDTALEMSEALFGLGFTVQRMENPSLDELRSAVTSIQANAGPVVIYYAGHGFAHDGASYLQPVGAVGDTPDDLAAVSLPAAALFAASGTSETMVFLDTCHGPASQAVTGAGALDRSLAETSTGIFNLLTVTSVQPGVACPADADAVPSLTPFLLERLTVPGMPSTEILPEVAELPTFVPPTATEEELAAAAQVAPPPPGIWSASTLTNPFVFRIATSDVRLSADDYRVLDNMSPAAQQQMIAMWRQAGIVVDIAGVGAADVAAPTVDVVADDGVVLVAPVAVANAVRPVAVASVGTVNDGVTIFNATPAPVSATLASSRPVPGAGGLPRPSVIVGLPEETINASFEAAAEDVGPVSGSELSYDNLDARRALRDSDAALFASLVEGGAFDPPDALLATALQTELARMKCYTSTIDGIWGRGSRASVDRYYEEAGGSSPSQDPDVRIFRQIVLKDDVECPPPPAPVAAAPRRQTTTTTTTRRQTTQAAPARRATPAPAPAPAPAAPARRTLSTTGGTGVFR